jgi:hypothetical protein
MITMERLSFCLNLGEITFHQVPRASVPVIGDSHDQGTVEFAPVLNVSDSCLDERPSHNSDATKHGLGEESKSVCEEFQCTLWVTIECR